MLDISFFESDFLRFYRKTFEKRELGGARRSFPRLWSISDGQEKI